MLLWYQETQKNEAGEERLVKRAGDPLEDPELHCFTALPPECSFSALF